MSENKKHSKQGIQGNFNNLIQGIYKTPAVNIMLIGENWMLSPRDQE